MEPICPVFGKCGGCLYQDISYEDELKIKEKTLRSLIKNKIDVPDDRFRDIVPSPTAYYYRNRLDLRLLKTKNKDIFIGFSPNKGFGVIEINKCFIARKEISDFIPELKKQAAAILPERYRLANLVVRTGDDGRVFWGGIGRRSCQLDEKDYLWTQIRGKRIFYSLDTFFQANLSILPKLFDILLSFNCINHNTLLFDLYGGVGLFAIVLADKVNRAYIIEENKSSVKLAKYNIKFNNLSNIEVIKGKVEERYSVIIEKVKDIDCQHKVAIIDPPRAGLSRYILNMLVAGLAQKLDYILYLSCYPESLVRDLRELVNANWAVNHVIPFDFFPRTRHIETLVILSKIR